MIDDGTAIKKMKNPDWKCKIAKPLYLENIHNLT